MIAFEEKTIKNTACVLTIFRPRNQFSMISCVCHVVLDGHIREQRVSRGIIAICPDYSGCVVNVFTHPLLSFRAVGLALVAKAHMSEQAIALEVCGVVQNYIEGWHLRRAVCGVAGVVAPCSLVPIVLNVASTLDELRPAHDRSSSTVQVACLTVLVEPSVIVAHSCTLSRSCQFVGLLASE